MKKEIVDEVVRNLNRVLYDMPQPKLAALYMATLRNYTIEEIANAHFVPVSTVRQRISDARVTIYRAMRDVLPRQQRGSDGQKES